MDGVRANAWLLTAAAILLVMAILLTIM
jgi:hypothetical protein